MENSSQLDLKSVAIIGNGKDITADIEWMEWSGKVCFVTLHGKQYTYTRENIEVVSASQELDVGKVVIRDISTSYIIRPSAIYAFQSSRGVFFHIHTEKGDWLIRKDSDLLIDDSLSDEVSRKVFSYLKQLSSVNSIKGDDGEPLLEKEYEKLWFIKGTVLPLYLNPSRNKIAKHAKGEVIYPFGCNSSQMQAVENALSNSLSVIQGPPGTGKTQTILNIIANILIRGENIIIVSNNNAAIENVKDKLESDETGLGFITAYLGNSANKESFFSSQSGSYPDFSSWKKEKRELSSQLMEIKNLSKELKELFSLQADLAVLKKEYGAFKAEKKHYDEYLAENTIVASGLSIHENIPSEILSDTYNALVSFSEEERGEYPFFFRVKTVLFRRIGSWKTFSKVNETELIASLEKAVYVQKEREYERRISDLEEKIKDSGLHDKTDRLKTLSMGYLKGLLFTRYGERAERPRFDMIESSQSPTSFLEEYPVVLSTCFSSHSSLRNAVYDYLVMDEASQVNITEGALSVAAARNAVIVGDLKQLPNVVTENEIPFYQEAFHASGLQGGYSYVGNSFLSSLLEVCKGVPETLLKEHYRCHPKIIGFCNERFYGGNLIVMTEDHGEDDVIKLLLTPKGFFRRGNSNRRQREVLVEYIEKELGKEDIAADDLAIISPYRKQVEDIREETGLDSDTVHKFQGREKDTVAITLVDDVAGDFSDNPNLLNVAISRAKKHLIVVASANEQPDDSNIAALIAYARYNSFSIEESSIYSVFDLLYKENDARRKEYLKAHKKVSEYDSENLMGALISDVLSSHKGCHLYFVAHYPLRYIANTRRIDSPLLREYLMHSWTHLDFLIYDTIGKSPVLAIEVDGCNYHKKGVKQEERDRKKDEILSFCSIPLMRFRTDGSREKEALEEFLEKRIARR